MDGDVADALAVMQRRLAALEQSVAVRQYDTPTRPAAAGAKGAVIFNTTTGKHEGSDGTSWNALY